jgi:hypothetical protein
MEKRCAAASSPRRRAQVKADSPPMGDRRSLACPRVWEVRPMPKTHFQDIGYKCGTPASWLEDERLRIQATCTLTPCFAVHHDASDVYCADILAFVHIPTRHCAETPLLVSRPTSHGPISRATLIHTAASSRESRHIPVPITSGTRKSLREASGSPPIRSEQDATIIMGW